MNPLDGQYVKLQLGTSDTTKPKWLIAMRATADYYGWTKHFEPWGPKPIAEVNGVTYAMHPGTRGGNQWAGGVKLRIGRAEPGLGYARQATNRFRVSSAVSQFDLAELAHFTEGDWHWMETKAGVKVTADRWESMYQVGTAGRKGGLVSD